MSRVTILLGAMLVLLGLVGFFGTGGSHATALIPAGFGAVFLLLGLLGLKESLRKHVMHLSAAVALLGLLGTAGGAVKLVQWAAGEETARPVAAIAQAIMATLLVVYLGLSVKSFIDARLRRRSGNLPA